MKFDADRGSAPPVDGKDGPVQHPLFANLETRRKRRESTNMAQTKVYETTDPQPLPPDASSSVDLAARVIQPLRSSAKRKLNTEEENKSRGEAAEKSLQDESDFMFNRSRQVLADSNKSIPAKPTTLKCGDGLLLNQIPSWESTNEEVTRERKAKDVVIPETISNRKALGPSKSKLLHTTSHKGGLTASF